ncbi:tetratricopeptide repeat protein, partial [Arsenicibacter rosenii]|uniref:tetratricopeptide repeat protein n=1 Tax=Arsenicibacter rosenii TaxID=1750698 RepID=UPI00116077B1
YTEQAFRYPFLSRRDEVSTYNNTAMVYLRLKRYTKADSLFHRTISLARSYGDTTYEGIASGEYGRSFLLQGHTRQALPFLYRAYHLCMGEAPERSAIAALDLASALLSIDSTAKAEAFIRQARAIQTHNTIWADYALAYYQTQTLYERKAGHYVNALAYQDSVMMVKDSLRIQFNDRLVANTEIRTNAERYLSSLQHLEAEKRAAILIRNIICITLLVVTAAGGYALHQNRQKRQREKEILLERQKRADDELVHATAQLRQHMRYLQEKNELIEQLTAELAQPAIPEAQQRIAAVPVEDLLQRTLLTEADWQRFRRLFEQVYPGFFETLQQQYPDLTPADVRLLALSKLELPSKDIGFMLGVS